MEGHPVQPHHVADRRRLEETEVTQLAYVLELELNPSSVGTWIQVQFNSIQLNSNLWIPTQILFLHIMKVSGNVSGTRISCEIFIKNWKIIYIQHVTQICIFIRIFWFVIIFLHKKVYYLRWQHSLRIHVIFKIINLYRRYKKIFLLTYPAVRLLRYIDNGQITFGVLV